MKKYFFSPHKKKSAGYIFDEKFCNLNGLVFVDCSSDREYPVFLWLLFLFVFPFFGVHSTLFLLRVLYVKYTVLSVEKEDVIILSRSILPSGCRYFFDKYDVLVHNLEALYYYEEALAENSWFFKLIFMHQSLCLKFFSEKKLLYKASSIYCLALHESRFIRIIWKKENAFLLPDLFSLVIDSEKKDNLLPFFYGNFNNKRNVSMVKKIMSFYPDLIIYGLNPKSLSKFAKNNYKGAIEDFDSLVKLHILVLMGVPRAGVQTKLIEWIKMGGKVEVDRAVLRRLGLKVYDFKGGEYVK